MARRLVLTSLGLSLLEFLIFVLILWLWDYTYEAYISLYFSPWLFVGLFPALYFIMCFLAAIELPPIVVRALSYILLGMIVLYFFEQAQMIFFNDNAARFFIIYMFISFVIYAETMAYVVRKSEQ